MPNIDLGLDEISQTLLVDTLCCIQALTIFLESSFVLYIGSQIFVCQDSNGLGCYDYMRRAYINELFKVVGFCSIANCISVQLTYVFDNRGLIIVSLLFLAKILSTILYIRFTLSFLGILVQYTLLSPFGLSSLVFLKQLIATVFSFVLSSLILISSTSDFLCSQSSQKRSSFYFVVGYLQFIPYLILTSVGWKRDLVKLPSIMVLKSSYYYYYTTEWITGYGNLINGYSIFFYYALGTQIGRAIQGCGFNTQNDYLLTLKLVLGTTTYSTTLGASIITS